MSNGTRDLIVVGASAGGVEPLVTLARTLPANLPAAVFVVLHIPPQGRSVLASILDRAGPLHAAPAEDGEPIEHGRIYVAPPDCHLSLDDVVHVLKGPRENRNRPSVDVLFRSAAQSHGTRVIGVVLSGTLDDGTAGLAAVKNAGGVAIVQEPDETIYPSMPRSAMAEVDVDHVLPSQDIAACLAELVRASDVEESEAMSSDPNGSAQDELVIPSDPPTAFTCPECGGALWERTEGDVLVFRCHVGHAYSQEAFNSAQAEQVEAALWSALRALKEKGALNRRTAGRLADRGLPRRAAELERRAEVADEQAGVLWRLLHTRDDELDETLTAMDEAGEASG
jgi:two-component system, chemotaxis family, protein-glutamate methylesterase/glutaminase